jgi:hypothetical protein
MSMALTPRRFCRRALSTHSCMQGPGATTS